MKLITRNLLKFATLFAIGSVLFRMGLSWSIAQHAVVQIWAFAILYFIFNAGIGWFFGKKDYEFFPINDIGFRFHFATYFVFNAIWELWFAFGLESRGESVKTAHLIALFWGIFLLFHFIIYLVNRKNSIQGLDKSEIFE
jgi:hypothetical protein